VSLYPTWAIAKNATIDPLLMATRLEWIKVDRIDDLNAALTSTVRGLVEDLPCALRAVAKVVSRRLER